MKHQATCERQLEEAFVSLYPEALEGLGDLLRRDESARRRYDHLAEVDLALARSVDDFAVLGPFENRIASSFESLSRFFEPAVEVSAEQPTRFGRMLRRGLAAAAVLLAVLVPRMWDRPEVEQPGIWTARGGRTASLRPYCVDPDGRRADVAIVEPGVASCDGDQYLLLAYTLRTDDNAWLHAVALPETEPDADAGPVWVVPNPVHDEPVEVEPADRPGEAWAPLDLSVNYPAGVYRIVWAMCDEPIPWTDWADAAEGGQRDIDDLVETRGDCEAGSWIFVVREVAP